MRTTLDIDDDVLLAAKELAKARKSTTGEVISQLARTALARAAEPSGPGPRGVVLKDGWYVLPRRGGAIATNELVERLRDEADFEDAGIKEP